MKVSALVHAQNLTALAKLSPPAPTTSDVALINRWRKQYVATMTKARAENKKLYYKWMTIGQKDYRAKNLIPAFVAWELTSDNPLVDLRVLKNRNFLAGTTIVFVIGIVLYATTALLPLFLQTLLNYSALQSGLAVSPRGLGSIAAILIVGNMMNILDRRFLMTAGLLLLAYSSFQLGQLDLDIAMFSVTWCIIINGFSTPMLFIPLTTSAVGTLKNEQIGNATSIYNLMRNIGGSFGISITTTLLSRVSQGSQNFLVQRITPLNLQFADKTASLRNLMRHQGTPALASQRVMDLIYHNVLQQAGALSFIYNFRLLAVLCVCCVPLLFMFKLPTIKPHDKPALAAAEA